MKFISCHITGYGALRNQTIEFNEGVTQLLQSNGTGKTTLASFLKAMLFGLDKYTDRSNDFKDRLHFCPFDGGSFGGTLTLEHQGNEYRIEKSFDVKSNTKDTVTVYKNGVETDEFNGKSIGEVLLGVNRESFEKTLFITADDIEMTATEDMKSKLGGVIQSSDNGVDYCKADKLLEDAIKSYKPERKTQKNDAYIPKTEEEINNLERKIGNTEKIQNALVEKYEAERKLLDDIKQKNAALDIARNAETRKAQTKAYRQLKTEIEEAKKAKTELENRYPDGIPSSTEISEVKKLQDARADTVSKSSVDTFTAEDRVELSKLNERFKSGIPTEAELNNAQNTLNEYTKLKTQYDGIAPEIHTGSVQVRSASPLPYIGAAIFGALIAIVGVVLLALNTTTLGAILTAFGAVILVVSGFLYLNKKTTYVSGGIASAENPERIRIRSEIAKKEDPLKAFLHPYGYRSENGLAYDFGMLKSDFDKYNSLKKRETTSQNKQAEAKRELDEIDASLKAIAEKYALTELNTDCLRDDLNELNRFNKDIDEKSRNAENYRNEHGITEESEAEQTAPTIDIETEEANVNDLRKTLTALQSQISDDEAETDKLDGYRSELEELRQKLREYEKRHELLSAARAMLEEANTELNNRYVGPVMEEFRKNSDMLTDAIGRAVTINPEYTFFFEENGRQREERYLSSGQRTLCALCFRIALIKNIYGDTAPTVILDDPFVTLDEDNIERAKTLLRALAEDMQILYFTCHPSREIGNLNQ